MSLPAFRVNWTCYITGPDGRTVHTYGAVQSNPWVAPAELAALALSKAAVRPGSQVTLALDYASEAD